MRAFGQWVLERNEHYVSLFCVPYPCVCAMSSKACTVLYCTVLTLVKLSLAVRRLSEMTSQPRGEHALPSYSIGPTTTTVYGDMRQTGLLLAYSMWGVVVDGSGGQYWIKPVRHFGDSDWLRRTHTDTKMPNFHKEGAMGGMQTFGTFGRSSRAFGRVSCDLGGE